jgi:hypothetical protein
MKFLYFDIKKSGKLYNLNVELGTVSRPILSSGTLGGKSKKYKNKKSKKNQKNKKNKSRKYKK